MQLLAQKIESVALAVGNSELAQRKLLSSAQDQQAPTLHHVSLPKVATWSFLIPKEPGKNHVGAACPRGQFANSPLSSRVRATRESWCAKLP